jgi:hypothetical protein
MATPVGYFLTPEQLRVIEGFLYHAKRTYKNRPLGVLGDDSVDHEEFPSPEVYVARTPYEGIPGFDSYTDVGTGTGAFPHTAECEIYKVDFSNDHMEAAGFTKVITNLSPTSIAGDKWIIVLRDKFGTWYAIDIIPGSYGFPARTTGGYETATGYPWERTILNEDGTFNAHPSGQQGEFAYCPDENTELPSGTDGWLFPNPDSIGTDTGTSTSTAHTDNYDTWIFIPVYRTRTTCDSGNLVFQISTDGGVTWVSLEDLGVECSDNIGTGTTSDNTGGGGPCELAKLQTADCLLASGPENSTQLEYSAGHWVSVADELTYFDGLCSGAVDFWYESGRVRLKVGGIELLHCGNNCFTGGPLTGHLPCDIGTGTGTVDPCEGRVFTVCVTCRECMHWYCVATQGECEGTATGTNTTIIDILELTETEAQELGVYICAGPFDTEGEAYQNCIPQTCTLQALYVTMSASVCGVQFSNQPTGGAGNTQSVSAGGGLLPDCTDATCGYAILIECNDDGTYNILPIDGYEGPPEMYGVEPLTGGSGTEALHIQITYTHTSANCTDTPVSITVDIRDYIP